MNALRQTEELYSYRDVLLYHGKGKILDVWFNESSVLIFPINVRLAKTLDPVHWRILNELETEVAFKH